MEFKPYEEYKKVDLPWIDKIPSHWEIDRGKNLFKQEKRKVKAEDEVITCFRDGEVTLRKNRRTTGFTESIQEIGYQGIKKGDLVIHQMDSFAGAAGVSDSDGKGSPILSICNGKILLNNYYYAFIVREMAHNGFIMSLSRGIRERSTDFRFKTFAEQLYPFPPKEEQDKIVDFLDYNLGKIDKFVELTKRQIEHLKEQKEVIINDTVTKGIDKNVEYKDSGIDWIGEIPKHWEVTRVKYISKILNGGTPNSSISEFWNGDVFWVTPKDLSKVSKYIYSSDRKITKEGYKNCSTSLIPKNNIIMATRAPIGNIKINKIETTINQGCKAILVDKNLIDLNYLYFLLNNYLEELQLLGNGATFVELSTSNLSQFKINIPPKKEQKEIVAYIEKEISKIDRTIEIYKNQIELIKEYRTSLIASAVTGKIDVRNF